MAGERLQGPHVYDLYESYDMTTQELDRLFVAGFTSSMVVGTYLGYAADKYGRRTSCMLYGILNGAACIAKHFPNFWILILGRVLDGASTSLLYSAFESWLVHEHRSRGFDSTSLGNIFSVGVLANSVVAVLAGLLAENTFGLLAPSNLSLVVLLVMVNVIKSTWSENYGDPSSGMKQSFGSALENILEDPEVLCLGLIQALFEGAMYCFVMKWTPSLSSVYKPGAGSLEEHKDIPHGYIFAGFMVAVMIGSFIFKILSKWTSIESFMRVVFLVASLSLLVPVIYKGNQLYIFVGFLVFETCVGIFWPSMGTMRKEYVADDVRTLTMNIFRIPLNLVVVVILLHHMSRDAIFKCWAVFLVAAALAQHVLYKLCKSTAESTFPLNENASCKPPSDDSEKLGIHKNKWSERLVAFKGRIP